ncbi:sodium-dependent transporter [Microbulbifer thermotolerans]|uniref:Sodium-dependent transporter n=1 Tax=Microbulbifer thermotolerans TaxID=252514 RepID=A0A143HJE4_MICTH|nr:sodium-dependent transporter [Microbulbifer thermotolerans]AMX01783.1 sodium-dependent transporter [Microbulbifer thermotolerans]MCX2779558.1 sodium-dependent transporter [Microbulbifer thermotolerans]MCX2783395.1 sodium-dependent transporter [Microbulbifer thermotolerans]MCX2793430.1 sodium-dependent transporter [Microbulbifer thermotolerans]MCX2802919.1 sodium-dependent transporter [Microbulbifer thermotolerans]
MSAVREHFGSRLGFILAAAGSAVGIGNLVAFPVAATKSGGGAFLLVYALFVFFICLPVMMAELALGRRADKDPVGAYRQLSGGSRPWTIPGWLALFTPFMIAVFYLVVTVWILGYLVETLRGNLDQLATETHFGQFINSPVVFVYLVVLMLGINAILAMGVKDGIERASKTLMPMLFIMLLGLVIFVLTRENAMLGVKYYLIPDFAKIDSAVVSKAMAQAFFSLSLGMGIMITYGSYMKRGDSIPGSSRAVAITDTLVAFTAGLLILPSIFHFDPQIDPTKLSDSSAGMIFLFLPKIFFALQDSIGYFGASAFAAVFFFLVLVAAVTSLMSIIEVPIATLCDERGMERKKAIYTIAAVQVFLAVGCAVSFGMVKFFTQFVTLAGESKSFFDLIELLFYDTILPLNGLLVCLFVIYKWKKTNFDKELQEGDSSFAGSISQKYINFSLGTFIPLMLLLIFINTVALKFFGHSFI